MDKKYTKEELIKQRDHIISEFDYRRVFSVYEAICDAEERSDTQYKNIQQIRDELTDCLDRFIKQYLEKDLRSIYINDKWFVYFSFDYDGETLI